MKNKKVKQKFEEFKWYMFTMFIVFSWLGLLDSLFEPTVIRMFTCLLISIHSINFIYDGIYELDGFDRDLQNTMDELKGS